MSRWGIKIDEADRLFSLYLRTKHPVCEHCKKNPSRECSHFYGRRHEATRYDEDNCDAVCHYCHEYFHENPGEYTQWKKEKLGDKRYGLLRARVWSYYKKDRKLELIKIKLLIKEAKYDIK